MAFDFPTSPSVGDAAHGYVWDGQKWPLDAFYGSVGPPPGTTVGPIGLLLLMMGVRFDSGSAAPGPLGFTLLMMGVR